LRIILLIGGDTDNLESATESIKRLARNTKPSRVGPGRSIACGDFPAPRTRSRWAPGSVTNC